MYVLVQRIRYLYFKFNPITTFSQTLAFILVWYLVEFLQIVKTRMSTPQTSYANKLNYAPPRACRCPYAAKLIRAYIISTGEVTVSSGVSINWLYMSSHNGNLAAAKPFELVYMWRYKFGVRTTVVYQVNGWIKWLFIKYGLTKFGKYWVITK